jgi:hypothetical protein
MHYELPQVMPNQTKKTAAAQEKVKAKLKKRADDEMLVHKNNAERMKRMRDSQEDMKAELRRRIEMSDSMRIKPKDPKELAAEGNRQMRAQLKRLKESVASAVSKRRFLFDQYKMDARKKEARKKALERIGAAVFDAPVGEDVGDSMRSSTGSWKAAARKDEHSIFREDEKEELELYDDDDFEDSEGGEDSKSGN